MARTRPVHRRGRSWRAARGRDLVATCGGDVRRAGVTGDPADAAALSAGESWWRYLLACLAGVSRGAAALPAALPMHWSVYRPRRTALRAGGPPRAATCAERRPASPARVMPETLHDIAAHRTPAPQAGRSHRTMPPTSSHRQTQTAGTTRRAHVCARSRAHTGAPNVQRAASSTRERDNDRQIPCRGVAAAD